MDQVVFTSELFLFNECIGQRGTCETLVEPSRITGRVPLVARVDGSIDHPGSKRHQGNITPSNFGWCLSQQA